MLVALAKVGNVFLLLITALMLIEESFPNDPLEILFVSFLLLMPIINFIVIYEKGKFFDVWPFILFKRLAIEEKRKIEELQKRNS